jgi:exonuclease III
MMGISIYLSIITLNVNSLSSPVKRCRLAEWIKKQDPNISCLQEMHLTGKDKQVESERIENDIPSKWNLKASKYLTKLTSNQN